MNNLKRILALVLALMMSFALVACGGTEEETKTETKTEEKVEEKTEEPKEEVKEEEPAKMTEAEELEAMKKEPMYESGFKYIEAGGCTSSIWMADYLGYLDEYGLKAEAYRDGGSFHEVMGSNACQVGVTHIAAGMVPISNGVNYAMVSGSIVGCQSLFVLADSGIETTADLIGKKVSAPNGIGGSSYNIGVRLFDADGINAMEDLEFVVVEVSACLAAMQNGEIDAVVTGDQWAYDMLKNGTLKCIRSITYDPDFTDEPCCINAMNKDFIKENPLMAKYITKAITKAQYYAAEHPEEMVQAEMDAGIMSGDFNKMVELWQTYQWGVCDNEFTERALREVAEDYVRLGLLTSMDDVDKIMETIWWPQDPDYINE